MFQLFRLFYLSRLCALDGLPQGRPAAVLVGHSEHGGIHMCQDSDTSIAARSAERDRNRAEIGTEKGRKGIEKGWLQSGFSPSTA